MEEAEVVKKIVSNAKQKSGGRASGCPESVWESYAKHTIATLHGLQISIADADIDMLADVVLNSVLEALKGVSPPLLIPKICSVAASLLDRNLSKKRTYEETTLEAADNCGAFVSVKSYTKFCLAMGEPFELQEKTQSIMMEPIANLFPRESCQTNPSETPRSATLSRLLQAELATLDHVECIHQCPIVPKEKQCQQHVDAACIVRDDAGSVIAAVIEYKPTEEFSSFRTQAAVYGTDTMNISGRPCLVVQIRGMSMDSLDVKAYGVVVNQKPQPSHSLSLLFYGSGPTGLTRFLAGLKAYLTYFPNEGPSTWHQGYLSNCVSLHRDDAFVYKSYDYRLRKFIPDQDRRKPNIELVKKFVDENATMFSFGEDFHIVRTKFLSRHDGKTWYGAILPGKLAQIVKQLKSLHDMNFVHGDVRLRNMILHEGRLTDFDLSRPVHSLYPSTLLEIVGDGKRHEEVAQAIRLQTRFEDVYKQDEESFSRREKGTRIGKLTMKFEHDVFAMMHILQNFRPVDESFVTDWEGIVASNKDLSSIIEPLNSFSHEVEFRMRFAEGHTPSGGTGSPQQGYIW